MPEALRLREEVERLAAEIAELADRSARSAPWQFMEVCGTHAHAVGRLGLRQLLPASVRLLSGPGCPVCVTSPQEVDWAQELAARPGTLVATFGDMLRVPGSAGSLADLRGQGAAVQVVYSPLQAAALAAADPQREVVFLAVGFETTAPAVALLAQAAEREHLENLSLLCCHKLVPPALRALLAGGEVRLDGLLCPGHVSAVIGLEPYRALAEEFHTPCAVAGFEAHDLLRGVLALLRQATEGRAEVENHYPRAVREEGNPRAREAVAEVFTVVDADWRGLGRLPASGLALREPHAHRDAARRFGLRPSAAREHPACRCGEVLRGVREPPQCESFGGACTPQRPLGPCMVSSEGACAAAYRYGA